MRDETEPLSDATRRRLQHAARQHEKWLHERDKEIRQARRENASWRAIAQATGLSHIAVKKIVERDTEKAG